MFTAYIEAVHLEDPGNEDPAGTRERLKDRFPRNATRRMTQLGLLIGTTLEPLKPSQDDTLVYASEFAETRALEAYLDSFPSASPTLFQTSIHPSAVQQLMIQRQQPVKTFFPMTGRGQLVAQALQVALLSDSPRALFCGGEERGTWLLDNRAASERTFAFTLALVRQPGATTLGSLTLSQKEDARGSLTLLQWFEALRSRSPLRVAPADGLWLELTWS